MLQCLQGADAFIKPPPLWSICDSGQGVCERVFNVVWQYWVFSISSTKTGSDWSSTLVSLVTTGMEHIRALKAYYGYKFSRKRHTKTLTIPHSCTAPMANNIYSTTVLRTLIIYCSFIVGPSTTVSCAINSSVWQKVSYSYYKGLWQKIKTSKCITGESSIIAMALQRHKAVGMQVHPHREWTNPTFKHKHVAKKTTETNATLSQGCEWQGEKKGRRFYSAQLKRQKAKTKGVFYCTPHYWQKGSLAAAA